MRRIFFLFILIILTGCEKYEVTNVNCIVDNHSEEDLLVVSVQYVNTIPDSTTVETGNDHLVFSSSWDGSQSEPTFTEFMSIGEFVSIYVEDSLVLHEEPLDKSNWTLFDTNNGDNWTTYYYSFTVTDSLIATATD